MRARGITKNVVFLGWVSFFADVASEMLYPIMPLFLTATLGASPAMLGIIEGLAEGTSSGLRWVGGALSDRFGRRKPFVVFGYALSAASKPVMGLSAWALGWPLFLVGRLSDRLGKTVRTAARDAMIADSTDASNRGAAFGFHRGMDTYGAVVGPLLAFAALKMFPGLGLSAFFFIALVPGAFSVFLAITGVREVEKPSPDKSSSSSSGPGVLPGHFKWMLVGFAVFSLGNSSDSFLILRSKESGLSFSSVVLVYALYNAVSAVASPPLGRLSDRIGRKPLILVGWGVYALVYLGFASFRSSAAPWVLLPIYGLYQALTDGVAKAMVSDAVPAARRAASLGMFSTVSGVGQLGASLLAGAVWNVRVIGGHFMLPFVIGALCAVAGMIVMFLSQPGSRRGAQLC